jgi:hypothetical protein
MDFLEKIPAWLRWILFLPAGLVAFSLVYPIIMIVNCLFSWGEFESYLGQLFLLALAGGWSGFVFVWIGAKIAPREQLLISIILALILALITGFLLIARMSLGDVSSVSWAELLISAVAGFIGAIAACYFFMNRALRYTVGT